MEYTKLLIVHVLISQIPLCVFLLISLKYEHDYRTKKHMKRKDSNNSRKLANAMWYCSLVVLISCAVDVVPLIPDFVDTQYECISGDYERFRSGRYDMIMVTSDDGKVLILKPLKGFGLVTGEQYPFCEYEASVWYTVHGNYAVEVIMHI